MSWLMDLYLVLFLMILIHYFGQIQIDVGMNGSLWGRGWLLTCRGPCLKVILGTFDVALGRLDDLGCLLVLLHVHVGVHELGLAPYL